MSLWRKINKIFAIGLLLSMGFSTAASAVCTTGLQTCSTSYGVGEVFFGSGGSLNSCSASYCSKQSLGETGVGNTKSTSYQAQAGFNTDRLPSLTFVVNTANINLGILTPGTTATATATFNVKTYLSNGYVVQTESPGPVNGSHTLSLLTSPTASSTSSEQFGMNLVANSSCGGGMPAGLGANPVQVPSSSFSFGTAAHNSASDYYDTACKFMYQNGDTIAQSTRSSGETDYTISYIFNITALTPGGIYTMNQSLVATSTF